MVIFNQGRESRKDELEQDLDGSCRWLLSVLPQLVDIIVAYIRWARARYSSVLLGIAFLPSISL